MFNRILIFGWAKSVHVQRWAKGLSGRGYHVKVVSLGGEPLPGIETVVLPRKSRMSYFSQRTRAAAEAQAFKPDLVHVHYAGGFGLWGLRCGIKPLVVSVWGSDMIPFRPRWLGRKYLRFLLNRATHITATSKFLYDTTVSICPGARQKLSVIPFGVEVPLTVAPPAAGPVKICYLKSHEWKYGPDILLHAMAEAKREIPDLTLWLAGDGSLTAKLKNLVKKLTLDANVRFVGFIPPNQIPEFIQEHHLMVMPSRFEAFGVAALEASAGGRPVIASNVGGIPEVVRDGVTGILVEPNDRHKLAAAIIRLACDAKTRENMGNAGREFVKANYQWERSLDLMCELYERLIREKATA